MNYLFCLLANREIQRLNDLPDFLKSKFDGKLTEIAMDHVAVNDIPDYIEEIEKHAEYEEQRLLKEIQERELLDDDFEEEDEEYFIEIGE
jgi:hypothetical protein